MLIRVEQGKGKGKKDRYVILSPILLEILHEWWRVARKKGWMSAGQPWLFPGYRGQHTSARQLHRIVRLAAGRAGITKRCRRSYAAALLLAGPMLEEPARLMNVTEARELCEAIELEHSASLAEGTRG